MARELKMYTLAYESIELHDFAPNEMERLLTKSRKYNNKKGITGCLIYFEGRFVQILEGQEERVKKLFSIIEADERHGDIRLFSEDTIDENTFPNWGMAYYPINKTDADSHELEQFRKNIVLLSTMSPVQNVTSILFWKRVRMYLSSKHPKKSLLLNPELENSIDKEIAKLLNQEVGDEAEHSTGFGRRP